MAQSDQERENEAALNARAEERQNERLNPPAPRQTGERNLQEEEMRARKMGSFAPGTSGAKGPDYAPETVDGAGNPLARSTVVSTGTVTAETGTAKKAGK